MPSLATTPGRMEILARALDRAVATAVVPRLRIDELRSSFVATDPQGRSWTLDPESHRWRCLHGKRWMFEDPPQQLLMDSELRASLEALEAMASRATVRSADALYAPRACWFRAADSTAELPAMPPSMSSRESATPPQLPLDREQAPFADHAPSSKSRTPRARAARRKLPARPATEDSFLAPAQMASVTSAEVSGSAEPAIRTSEEISPAAQPAAMAPVISSTISGPAESAACASVETTPAPESVPVLTATPTRNSSIRRKPAPAVASRVAAQAARSARKTTPSRLAIPAAHLRFAGPGFGPVSDDLAIPAVAAMAASEATGAPDRIPASTNLSSPMRTRDASSRHERWVPTSIAPRLTSEHPEPRYDRTPVFLCALVTALFLALASWKGDGRHYAGALLFGLLTVTLLTLNLARNRQD